MSAIWVDELLKIREKVQARKPAFFLLRAKRRESMDAVEDEEENQQQGYKAQSPSSTTVAVNKNDSTLSEATVCLLMDRFAPC